jgi:NADPH:quinone reductase-like Zn-dependent oxidoreductase
VRSPRDRLYCMKAVSLLAYGDTDQLSYGDFPDPVPADDEVLVKVAGTSINPSDWKMMHGFLKEFLPLQFPAILGSDVAGEVISAGANAGPFTPGDRVLGYVRRAHAEFVTAKPEELALLPEGMDFDQAAVIPLVTLTGTQLIERGIQPKAAEVVLVTGALGLVGRTALYIAKSHGAIVIAGVRAAQKPEAHSLRADHVVAIDDDQEIAALREVDAIADTVGGATLAALLPKLKKSGKLATVVGPSAAAEKAGIHANALQVRPDSKRLAQLAEDVREGDLVIPIGERFNLAQIRDAMLAAEKGKAGKVLLIP